MATSSTARSFAGQPLVGPKPSHSLGRRAKCTGGNARSHRSSARDVHSLLQTFPHSQSITNLHRGASPQDSYALFPPTFATAEMAACSQNLHASRCCAARCYQLPASSACCERSTGPVNTTTATRWPLGHSCQQYEAPVPPDSRKSYPNGCYSGYEPGNRLTDEEDSAFPALQDREFHILHRSVPALRRSGVDTTAIRQHFYPEGGWGWIICSVSFLVHLLTTGLQLSFGLLLFFAVQHLPHSGDIEWLGALSWSISMAAAPFVVTLCRKKSTRLTAVVGGLIMSLGVLFTSFATEFGQILFSYGLVFAVGAAMVRESSSTMLGNYFKKRRLFVEMVALAGEGVGIALFSVVLKEGVGKAGWRLGLQLVASLMSVSFFMGMLYRPASLYHPQRRAIQHLKNQRKKMREKKLPATSASDNRTKAFILDISPLRSTTVKIILLTSSVAALGIYAPIFAMSINAAKEGSDVQDLVLLQTFLGMAAALGVVLAGTILRRPFRIGNKLITTRVVTQVFISTIAVAILFLSFVMGYRGLCVLSWVYGLGFGGYRYSIKVLTLELVKIKHFSKAWGLIKGAESIPVLISVPLTSFLNDYSPKYGRAGYYICSAAAAISGITIFFLSYTQPYIPTRKLGNGRIATLRSPLYRCGPSAGCVHGDWEYPAPDAANNSCVSLNRLLQDPNFSCRNRVCSCGPISRQLQQYHPGQGSVGARVGRRLQRSLSFIHNPCGGSGHCFCECRGSLSWKPPPPQRGLVCTCSPASQYQQTCKSRSVPEGLSWIAQCTCNEAPVAGYRCYLPGSPPQLCSSGCPQCHTSAYSSVDRQCRRQRSQSLSQPFQFAEQITSV